MDKKVIKHEGELQITNDISIPCYVLEDGTRILSGRQMQVALKMVDTEDGKQTAGTRLDRYLTQNTLKEFIFNGKEVGHYDPIECWKGNTKINGFEATVLVDICDAFLQARKKIKLAPRQAIIAEQCEILVRSFAKVGIIALVDEATGYQYDRERYELQQILKAYISEDILDWQLTFSNSFYKEVFRLWGIPYTPQTLKRKPMFVGKITNQFVYDMMPQTVIEKIKEKTPKTSGGNYKYRFHQSLTPEIGREHLKRQIIEVTTLMSISESKSDFKRLFGKKYGQTEIDFSMPNEIPQPQEDVELSSFDSKLKKALNYNPKDK